MLFVLLSFVDMISQEVLDNNAVLSMLEMEFDDALIIDKIENSENTFDTSINVLGELKKKGVSQSILSAMIKSSKKEVLEAEVDPLNNLEYTFSDGAKSYTVHLAKDEYYKELNGLMLNSVITTAMFSAKTELKNKSTYNPTFINLIRDAKKNENIISILGTAQNDFGATKDTHYKQDFQYNPKLISSSSDILFNDVAYDEQSYNSGVIKIQNVDYWNDKNNQHFIYKYIELDGSKSKQKGELFIGDNYVIITSEPTYGVRTPDIKFLVFKKYENESDWECKASYKGMNINYRYDSQTNKYKSTGGAFTMEMSTGSMVYYLVKD